MNIQVAQVEYETIKIYYEKKRRKERRKKTCMR